MAIIKLESDLLHGYVYPGYEKVRDEFITNFEKRNEIGAACSIYYHGQKVVDLWGGYRDLGKRLPWEEDTLVLVFSTTKGLAAMTLAMLHSRGLLDYEEKVSAYWPEFGQNGKGGITVRHLLSHQAGLPCLEEGWDWDTLSDLDALAEILARQQPVWEPGTRHGYHSLTIGLYENELVRRVDPQHRSLGIFFREEIAQPLDMEFYIGLPEEIPLERIAVLHWSNPVSFFWQMILQDIQSAGFAFGMMNPKSLTSRSLSSGMHLVADTANPRFRGVELPSTGGIGRASAVARAYCAFATGGIELGISPQTLNMLTAADREPSRGIFDQVLRVKIRHSLGFGKPCPYFSFGRSSRAFGWAGMGGSMGYADPDNQIGFGYVMNRIGYRNVGDPRAMALMNAFYNCI